MKKILTSIWLLALVIAIPVIIFFPRVFEKYQLQLNRIQYKADFNGNTFFYDLQNNGTKERIESFHAKDNLLGFHCFDENNRLIDQYNFPHFYNPSLTNLFFFDLDKDNLTEVYGFTIYEDSVFLSWIEPLDKKPVFNSVFITTIDINKRKALDVSIREMVLTDFDNDRNMELVFSLAVGYNWFPRKIYLFHPEKRYLEYSEEFGVHFYSLNLFDYKSDGNNEIACVSSSACNIEESVNVPFTDDRPRLFVFNDSLKPVFKPIEFPGGIGSFVEYYFLDQSTGEIILLYHNISSENTMTFVTKVFLDGENYCPDTLFINQNANKKVGFYKISKENFLAVTDKGKIYWIDNDLRIIDKKDLEFKSNNSLLGLYESYEDGTPEFYALEDNRILHVYMDDFKIELTYELGFSSYPVRLIPNPYKNEFILDSGGNLYMFNILPNKFFILKYPFYLLVYLASVLFIWFLQLARMRQIKEKNELQNQVRELQLKTLKNQLDPHFIFNTFNTIASVIKQEKRDDAYDLFVHLSKMVRANLDNANEIYTTLKGEINFIKDYLYIQKFRFTNTFDYRMELSPKVMDSIKIPKMLIQIHVENALKHGLRTSHEKGQLIVRTFYNKPDIIIEIEDNGVGRDKSKEFNKNKGIGLKTIKQIIELNNQKGECRISQQIIDLKDELGKAVGTKVILRLSKFKSVI